MSPKVTLKLLFVFNKEEGYKKETKYEAKTVKEILGKFLEDYKDKLDGQIFDELGVFKDWMLILVNGRNINLIDGLETKLDENDVVTIMPPIGGG
jgi:MoaD family protein